MISLRRNLRSVVLAIAIVVALFLLFGPAGGAADGGNATAGAGESGMTNLEFGIDLAGGTQIRAPLVGTTATGIDYRGDNRTAVEAAVAEELSGVGTGDVVLVPPEDTVSNRWALEVRANVTRQELRAAVETAGLEPQDVRPGVTRATREEAVQVLQNKIDETGLQGGTVRTVFRQGRHFVEVEVPGANSTQVRNVISERGKVRVLAYHPVQRDNGTVFVNRTVLTNEDFNEIGIPREGPSGPQVGVTIERGQTARRFQADMVETGIAARGGSSCGWPGGNGPCMLIVKDGQVIGSFGMQQDLAASMRSGSWADDPSFILPTNNMSQAQRLSINLRAGALPTRLALDRGTTRFVSPAFGTNTQVNAVIAAAAAIVAVSAVVGVRYGDVRVATTMVLTGLSEVLLMLGFAAGVGLALDISHIAGFIAVIGTGVDDLVIIADDVLQQESVATAHVFKNRFRKALWVIGAAAATTIVAMTPIVAFNIQDLLGFAIVTIAGVLIGVLVTRPAYGDVLRWLVLD